ncbi:MAG: hypothetical protein JEZ02_20185 [Desulfatibacillum sp.]|nr:hypothetical protein [Desulfatibacillum sp.]
MQKLFPLWVIVTVFLLGFPLSLQAGEEMPASPTLFAPVTYISLEGPASHSIAEFSGMAWHGDRLILLPQYPGRFMEKGKASLFSIPKARILSYLDGTKPAPICPDRIPLDMAGVRQAVNDAAGIGSYEGFEAIAFWGDAFFLSIEAGKKHGFLVGGKFTEDGLSMVLDRQSLVSIPMPVQIGNKSYETIFIAKNRLIAIYEANGLKDNPRPMAQMFELRHPPEQAEYLGEIPFSHIEYRVTDITAWDTERPLVAINYFYPGDRNTISPTPDPGGPVEQLVALSFDGKTMAMQEIPPLGLKNSAPNLPRNWEGIVRLDDLGFLLVTDKWPETILAFAPDAWSGK